MRCARGEAEFEEPAERRASEPSPSAEFVPLSAEFAAQMTLFGAPQAAPEIAGGALSRPEPAPPATYERREELRRERGRLVGELHRRDGRAHREINAWLNRVVGVGRVEDASIEQLERSIAALVGELTRRRGRAAAG